MPTDLKNIKATAQPNTGGRFSQWVLVNGIGKVSPESKSTSAHLVKGLRSEEAVVCLLRPLGFTPLFRRLRTRHGEIDLVMLRGSSEIFLIEVKSLKNPWGASERIAAAQLKRLRLNTILLSQYQNVKNPSGFTFRAFVAWVSPENRISFLAVE